MSTTTNRKNAVKTGLVAGLGVAAVVGSAPLACAEIRIAVPGASPDYEPVWLQGLFGKTAQQYAQFSPQIREGWFPGTTPEVVQYPASIGVLSGSVNAPTADQSLALGQAGVNSDIMNAVATGQPVVVAGFSMGTIVIDREQAYLAMDPNAPSPRQLTFIEFSPPARGFGGTYIRPGYTVPIVGYTQLTPPESQYQTVIV